MSKLEYTQLEATYIVLQAFLGENPPSFQNIDNLLRFLKEKGLKI